MNGVSADVDQRPAMSVVVIVYNDEARLAKAVRSVLEQTLRSVEVVIVDDHSTDGSYEVAARLAAEHPGRVRAYRLPVNSGGCGAPRNQGIRETRGEYVLFLDSDDVLERNACRNMLEAAETTGADLVSGLCVRVHVDTRTRKEVKWYPWLYTRTRTLDSISELPDLLVYDTLSTNKCYRRDFLVDNGLLFPVGIHYEDLFFSAQAYAAARRITLIPNRVYDWNVVQNSGKSEASISNRRAEIANFAHRMEIHRRVDRLLADRGMEELKFHKDVKFLKHDLVLHLRDLPFRDAAYRREFAELARAYLASVDPAAYDEVEPIHAICAYLLRMGDWDNLLPAVDTLTNRDKVSAPLAERDGRIYWCADHLDSPGEEGEFARRVLDVTELGYHARPVGKLFLRDELTRYEETGSGVVRLAGRVTNPLGIIPPGARLTAELEFYARRPGVRFRTFRVPVATVRHDGPYVTWQATADISKTLRPLGIVDVVWDVRLHLDVDGERTTSRLTAAEPGLATGELPVRPRLTRLVADRVEPQISARGHLAFRLVPDKKATVLVTRGLRGTPGRLAKSGYRRARTLRKKATSGDTKIRLYHEVFRRMPMRRRLVVFESHLGRQYSDSPRAIYEEMRRQGLDFEAVWSYTGRPEGFPADATLVRRWSLPYLRALARAEFWIDNQSFPLKLTKRPGTTYIQTWHGSALKRMGFDEPGWKLKSRAEQAEQQRTLDRFDHFLIRSEHDVRTLAKAFRLREKVLLRVGYPRNDALVRARGAAERPALAAELGIPEDKRILLYAPTFRHHGQRRFTLPFDVERFAETFGDEYVLLVRAHYLNHVVLPPSVRGRVIDVSAHHDVTPVLALADALITDYSSVMFDYALLDRPMLFFTYDYEEYVHEGRGTYFDLLERAPGPIVRTEDELHSVLRTMPLDEQTLKYAAARERFTAAFGEYDKGTAAQSVVDQFFSEWRHK
ncbi:bifunctional glycosyltransferase/CDP-glycerol:glycerophosphate glycerophosphotransferase [Streptomyces europaeiscabiei]|uniref:Bifunctional glycosyltransferase family 2 protein/CDP-glycerol:glycerophosphate glycerophosphotransferase n=1 Tax=Streptomyces europaeiscabiei TaxID=146819 RepID=A0ABU4NBZ6_9ACTN|nr:bifunctional glycosyltransferase family 2 protein/CDP-glycerol:glycerophosphate glycerophosphotransferase [Streptomyces europaeiscabiei]MDX2774181.1 bifunctional glycosyltransferase family 2 protein/CDP-glycerol:glycerophosphate glycerophosphotransferase [Streptomyces europaeiscabiei]MDX3541703.1 bifunctional glycosyltransferase family 2 protein/CDP-glycerol:glycerophosphate glycerophosphotransferase [Streptomyces europaeiscabiei]MDX3552044.1 bifunctional glycosyltransferase family 2 protein/